MYGCPTCKKPVEGGWIACPNCGMRFPSPVPIKPSMSERLKEATDAPKEAPRQTPPPVQSDRTRMLAEEEARIRSMDYLAEETARRSDLYARQRTDDFFRGLNAPHKLTRKEWVWFVIVPILLVVALIGLFCDGWHGVFCFVLAYCFLWGFMGGLIWLIDKYIPN